MSDSITLEIPDPDMMKFPVPVLTSSLTAEEIGVCVIVMGLVHALNHGQTDLLSDLTKKGDENELVIQDLADKGVLDLDFTVRPPKIKFDFSVVMSDGDEEDE